MSARSDVLHAEVRKLREHADALERRADALEIRERVESSPAARRRAEFLRDLARCAACERPILVCMADALCRSEGTD